MISVSLRDLLIEHIDGPVDVIVSKQNGTRAMALRLGFIRPDFQGMRGTQNPDRPRRTYITEKGRQELAAALADWADALSKARNAGFPIIKQD